MENNGGKTGRLHKKPQLPNLKEETPLSLLLLVPFNCENTQKSGFYRLHSLYQCC